MSRKKWTTELDRIKLIQIRKINSLSGLGSAYFSYTTPCVKHCLTGLRVHNLQAAWAVSDLRCYMYILYNVAQYI
jgi:hypothetical protein